MKTKVILEGFIPGDPVPQHRPYPVFNRTKGKVRMVANEKSKAYREWVQTWIQSKVSGFEIDGPFHIDLTFYIKRPRRLTRKKDPDQRIPHADKPDIDNLAKAVFDAITSARVWGDDCEVTSCSLAKYYVPKGDEPGLFIQLTQLEK